ncbi:hypothetical protein SAMN05421510_101612 [Nitrosomonas ureae]|uniref:Uncharacterized protein n=1 Tax=Nitrosomonas ureae TaxID=44577 RepID=A0A1H9CPG8_9PROT|nr:hypothetical protein C8R27_12817 [Nitrosomonas ureae]SDT99833.1 hypothetical protein SAMN05216406_11617 [Nitrosomonas ureae]SEQ03095.1 hypothetical protein SAMN05421510_101612 [Nitrosomonas ureae]
MSDVEKSQIRKALFLPRHQISCCGRESDRACLLKNSGFCIDRRYNHAVLRRKMTFEEEF